MLIAEASKTRQNMPHETQQHSRFVRQPWPEARTLRVAELGEGGACGPWLAFFLTKGGFEIEHRRLWPVPAGWRDLSDEELVMLFSVAVPARAPYRGDQLRKIERHVSHPEPRMPQPGSAEWHALRQAVQLEYLALALELLEVRAELATISRSSAGNSDETSAA